MFPSDQRDVWFLVFLLLAAAAAYPGARQLARDVAGILSRSNLIKARDAVSAAASTLRSGNSVPILAKSFDLYFVLPLIILVTLGIAGSQWGESLASEGSHSVLTGQVAWSAVGVLLFVAVSAVYPLNWMRVSLVMVVLAAVGLIAAAIFARSSVPPGETFELPANSPNVFASLAAITYTSAWLSTRYNPEAISTGFIPFSVIVGLVAGLVLVQPDLGTAVVIITTGSALYFVRGAPLRHTALFLLVVYAISLGLFASSSGGLVGDSSSIRSPAVAIEVDAYADSIAQGGPLGSIWRDTEHAPLPKPHTNGAYASVASHLGILGASLVLLAFAAIILRAAHYALMAQTVFLSLLPVGLACLIGFYALLNAAAAVHLLPHSGAPLPFVGYGETTLLSFFGAAGVCHSIGRYRSKFGLFDSSISRGMRRRVIIVGFPFLVGAAAVFIGTAVIALAG
jgi:cell division protein FtsW